ACAAGAGTARRAVLPLRRLPALLPAHAARRPSRGGSSRAARAAGGAGRPGRVDLRRDGARVETSATATRLSGGSPASAGRRVVAGARDAELLHPVAQRAGAEPEALRGTRVAVDHPAGRAK